LCRLRGLPPTDSRVQAEWLSIRVEAIHNREALLERHPTLTEKGFATEVKLEMASWVDMFKPAVIRRTMIGIALMFFQQFVGINAVSMFSKQHLDLCWQAQLIYYSPTLFETLGLDSSLQLHMSGVMNILQMVAVIAAFFVFDRIGRRPLLLIGSIGMCASHVIVAIMIGRSSNRFESR
jgi:MFS family permease